MVGWRRLRGCGMSSRLLLLLLLLLLLGAWRGSLKGPEAPPVPWGCAARRLARRASVEVEWVQTPPLQQSPNSARSATTGRHEPADLMPFMDRE